MKSMAKYGTATLVVAAAAAWLGWTDTWYLTTGLVTAGLPAAGLTAWGCLRAARRDETEPAAEPESEGPEDQSALAVETPDEDVAGVRESLVVGVSQGALVGLGLSV